MDEIALVKETTQYIKIKMGDEMYGIDIKYIDNIVRMQHITRVPKVPTYIKGVINLRGEVIPVFSLRLKMGMEEVEETKQVEMIDVTGLSIDVIRDITNSFVQVSVSAITWDRVVAQYGQLYDENYRPINYYAASNNTYYYRTANTGNVLGALVWCTSATRSFDINTPISVSP